VIIAINPGLRPPLPLEELFGEGGEDVEAVEEAVIVVDCWDVEATWIRVVCDGVEVVADVGESELLHDPWPPSAAAINSSVLMAMPPAELRQLEYATPADVVKSVHPHDDHIDCAAAVRKVVS
jgi:L-ascorbate metabolism protein UlaG (beta-lactamase superfamily)